MREGAGFEGDLETGFAEEILHPKWKNTALSKVLREQASLASGESGSIQCRYFVKGVLDPE